MRNTQRFLGFRFVRILMTLSTLQGFHHTLFGSTPAGCRVVFSATPTELVRDAIYRDSEFNSDVINRAQEFITSTPHFGQTEDQSTTHKRLVTSLTKAARPEEDRWYTPAEIGGGIHDSYDTDWLLKNPNYLVGSFVAGYTVHTNSFCSMLDRLGIVGNEVSKGTTAYAGMVSWASVVSSDILRRMWKLTIHGKNGTTTVYSRLKNDSENKIYFLGKYHGDDEVFSAAAQASQVKERIETIIGRKMERQDIPYLKAIAGIYRGNLGVIDYSNAYKFLKGSKTQKSTLGSYGALEGKRFYSEAKVTKILGVFETFYLNHDELHWDLVLADTTNPPSWSQGNQFNPDHISGMMEYLDFLGSTLPVGRVPKGEKIESSTDPEGNKQSVAMIRSERGRASLKLGEKRKQVALDAIIEAMVPLDHGSFLVKMISEVIASQFPDFSISEREYAMGRIDRKPFPTGDMITYNLPLPSLLFLNNGVQAGTPVKEVTPVAEVFFEKGGEHITSIEFAVHYYENGLNGRILLRRIQADEFRKEAAERQELTFDYSRL